MFRHYLLYFVKTSRLLHIALVLVVVGLTLCVGTQVQSSRWKWKPVDVPLPLNGPITLDVPFTTNTPGAKSYLISVVPRNNSEQMLWGYEEEHSNKEEFNLQIYANGQPIIVKTGNGIYGSYQDRNIGLVRIPSGQKCALHLEGAPLTADLRPLEMRLQIEVIEDSERTLALVQESTLTLLGAGLLLGGIAMTVRAVYNAMPDYHALMGAGAQPAPEPAL